MVKKLQKSSFSNGPCLRVANLACERGHNVLFTELSFSLAGGDVLHIAGSNGVGKSTLIRILASLYQPDSGTISWNDMNINEMGNAYRSEIAYLGHKLGLRDDMTPLENLRFYDNLAGSGSCSAPENCLDQLRVDEYRDTPLLQLSTGQKQRVAIARLCLGQKRLWLLDEPATALDSQGVRVLEDLIGTHTDRGGIVVFCSHQPLETGSENRQTVTLSPISPAAHVSP